MIVLGIETSCDETAIAIVRDDKKILSNQIYSQIQEHHKFGGVVPETAARAHIEHLPDLLKRALTEARITIDQIDAVAVTGGPGLIGGVMVGVVFAKTIASMLKKPFIAVNHLEGHALTVRLSHDICFPYLLLLISGGHCQFLLTKGIGQYEELSTTVDDASGEAFDKVAKLLGLCYPGGPAIEKNAINGNPNAYILPQPLCESGQYNFSFSGLKTATKQLIERQDNLMLAISDISASFQHTVAQIFLYKINQMISLLRDRQENINTLVIAGGVASNQYIRNKIEEHAKKYAHTFLVPPAALCTDNAAMIAWAGIERIRLGMIDNLDFAPRSRWRLTV
jgi:N6-L-threonylcarbamoyladenine synthase